MPATSLGATYLGLLTLLAVAVFLALTIGPVRIGFAQLWESIIGRGTAISDTILFDVRAPRMVLGVIVGGSLAMARASLQGLLRNPLADPGLIGITAGVSLAVVFVIVLGEMLLDNLPPLIVSTIIHTDCGFPGSAGSDRHGARHFQHRRAVFVWAADPVFSVSDGTARGSARQPRRAQPVTQTSSTSML